MFIKSILAAAAISSAVAFGSIGAAHADPHVSVGIGFEVGTPEYVDWNGGNDDGYDGDSNWRRRHRHHWEDQAPVMSYGISCTDGRNILASSGFRGVAIRSCSAAVYRYTAWKRGEQFRIAVSMRGRIVAVSPIY